MTAVCASLTCTVCCVFMICNNVQSQAEEVSKQLRYHVLPSAYRPVLMTQLQGLGLSQQLQQVLPQSLVHQVSLQQCDTTGTAGWQPPRPLSPFHLPGGLAQSG